MKPETSAPLLFPENDPGPSKETESPMLTLMKRFNRALHFMLGVALIVASLMVLVLFIKDVVDAFTNRTLIIGFLHALGSLLILWTFSELLNSEIRYLAGGRIEVAVFIEVAIAATIRHALISATEPFDLQSSVLTLGRLMVLGMVYWLMGGTGIRTRDDGSY